jgi:hypothetical protein
VHVGPSGQRERRSAEGAVAASKEYQGLLAGISLLNNEINLAVAINVVGREEEVLAAGDVSYR